MSIQKTAIKFKNNITSKLCQNITVSPNQKESMRKNVKIPVKKQSSKPMCRICYQIDSASNMLTPCNCEGSIGYIHPKCLAKWMEIKQINTCEICNQQFLGDEDDWEDLDQGQTVKYQPIENPFGQYVRNNPAQVLIILLTNFLMAVLSFSSFTIFKKLGMIGDFVSYFLIFIGMLLLVNYFWIQLRLQSSTKNTYCSIKCNLEPLIQRPSINLKEEKKRKHYMKRIRRCIRLYRSKNIGSFMFDDQDPIDVESQEQQ